MPDQSNANAPAPGVPVLDDATLQTILRRTKFAHLTDEQFEFMLAQCQKWQLDPWLDHVAVVVVPGLNGGRAETKVLIKLQALREKAEATGEHRGREGPQWCGRDGVWKDVWLDTAGTSPYAARVGIRRRGKRVFWGVAYWEAYCPVAIGDRGEPYISDEFWAKAGCGQLAKCAEALAIRAAFPLLGALYTNDEMAQAMTRGRASARPPSPLSPAPAHVDDIDVDEAPTSEMTFQVRLVRDFDLGSREEREAAIEHYKSKYARLFVQDRRRWWATVLHELQTATATAAASNPDSA